MVEYGLVIFREREWPNEAIYVLYFKVTNQVAELLACIKGIETFLGSQKTIAKQIIIYTDSMYIVDSISSWAKNWAKMIGKNQMVVMWKI